MNTIMKGDIERYYHRFTAKSFVMLSEGDQKLNTIKQNVFFFRNAYCNGLTIFTRSPINQEDNVIKEISDRKSFDKRIVFVRCKCLRFIYLVLV